MDPRNCNKFCVENEIKCARTFEKLTVAFGLSTISRTEVQLWYNRFEEGRASQQPLKTIEAVKKMILDNRGITVREVTDDVGILFGSRQAIFTDVLGMKHAAAKWLNFEQKQRHMTIPQEMLTKFNGDLDLLKKVIPGD